MTDNELDTKVREYKDSIVSMLDINSTVKMPVPEMITKLVELCFVHEQRAVLVCELDILKSHQAIELYFRSAGRSNPEFMLMDFTSRINQIEQQLKESNSL